MKISYSNEEKPREAFVENLSTTNEKVPTVDKSFPLVFFLLSLLGLNLAKREPLGQYRVAKWRIVPLLCIGGILVWVFMQHVLHASGGAVPLIEIVVRLNYLATVVFLAVTVLVTFWKRNDYCKFLTALFLPYPVSRARAHTFDLILLAYLVLSFYIYPWESTVGKPLEIALGVVTVLILPLIPALVDFQACCLIKGLADGHRDLVLKIQENPIGDDAQLDDKSSEDTTLGKIIKVLPFISDFTKGETVLGGSSWVEEGTGAIRVVVVRDQCRFLHDLVVSYNQVFCNVMALRCGLFLLKLMALTFVVLAGYPGHLAKFYLVEELARFYLVCSFSDSLFQQHQDVEDGVLALQESNNTYNEDRLLYHALASRMSARPAFVSIGGLVSLGRGMMASFINVALTYTVIMYQYRPV